MQKIVRGVKICIRLPGYTYAQMTNNAVYRTRTRKHCRYTCISAASRRAVVNAMQELLLGCFYRAPQLP